jgi:hypothetical protein
MVLRFDTEGELVGTSCGEVAFSPAHLAIGKRTGDGVLPVRSMVSTMGCICRQNILMLWRWKAPAYFRRHTGALCLMRLGLLPQPQ